MCNLDGCQGGPGPGHWRIHSRRWSIFGAEPRSATIDAVTQSSFFIQGWRDPLTVPESYGEGVDESDTHFVAGDWREQVGPEFLPKRAPCRLELDRGHVPRSRR